MASCMSISERSSRRCCGDTWAIAGMTNTPSITGSLSRERFVWLRTDVVSEASRELNLVEHQSQTESNVHTSGFHRTAIVKAKGERDEIHKKHHSHVSHGGRYLRDHKLRFADRCPKTGSRDHWREAFVLSGRQASGAAFNVLPDQSVGEREGCHAARL